MTGLGSISSQIINLNSNETGPAGYLELAVISSTARCGPIAVPTQHTLDHESFLRSILGCAQNSYPRRSATAVAARAGHAPTHTPAAAYNAVRCERRAERGRIVKLGAQTVTLRD